jgi:hypothetical protein
MGLYKRFSYHLTGFEVLKKLNSEFKDIQAFGSDGNLALLNAVAICYPSPLHLT